LQTIGFAKLDYISSPKVLLTYIVPLNVKKCNGPFPQLVFLRISCKLAPVAKEAQMRTFMLVLGLLLVISTAAQAQNPPPSAGVNPDAWKQLMDEVDKGNDPDDPGKMIRYWTKAATGSLTNIDKSELVVLVNRRPKRGFGPDGKVYLTMFAAAILEVNASRVAQIAKNTETDKQIADLRRVIDELRKMIDNRTPTVTAR
jgi:hypothetical protein